MFPASPEDDFTVAEFVSFLRIQRFWDRLCTCLGSSSKSAKLGAWKVTAKVRHIPGATSPLSLDGNFIFLTVNISEAGGMNLILLETLAVFVTLTEIS